MADQSGTYYFLRFVQGWESRRIIHKKNKQALITESNLGKNVSYKLVVIYF